MTEETRNRNYKYFRLLGWVLFFASLFFKGCGSGNGTNSISKPAKGTFETVTPKQVTLTKESISERTKKRPENGNSYVEKQTQKYYKDLESRLSEMTKENDSLRKNFASLPNDQKQKEFEKVTELKSFEQKYDNDDLTAAFNGVVQGEIKEVHFTYEMKPKKPPEVTFRMLVGIGINTDAINANLGFQNKKGNIFEVGYDTEKRINIGYKQSLFKITK